METDWERISDHLILSLEEINGLIAPSGLVAADARLIKEGKANTNYRLTLSDSTPLVLRLHTREPAAGGLERALSDQLADNVPLPRVLLHGTGRQIPTLLHLDTSALSYSLLEWKPGTTMERLLENGQEAHVLAAAEDLGRTLARISAVRFDQAGFLDENLKMKEPWPSVMDGLLSFFEWCLQTGNVDNEIAHRVENILTGHRADLDDATRCACLSHADYKASNLLIENGRLTGVLDWEFAHSGTWLLDAGQLFRHREHLPDGFEERFQRGFIEAGGNPTENWQRLARAIDLINLVGFLSRPTAGPNLIQGASRLVERTLDELNHR